MFSFPKTGILPLERAGWKCAPSQPSVLLQRFSHLLPRSGLALDLRVATDETCCSRREEASSQSAVTAPGALMAGREAALRANLKIAYLQVDLTAFDYPEELIFRAHLLERNELLQTFSHWEIIFYREVWFGRGVASLVARKRFSGTAG